MRIVGSLVLAWWGILGAMTPSRAFSQSSPADEYLARQRQAANQVDAQLLTAAHNMHLPCNRVVAHLGGEIMNEQPVIVAVVCETQDGTQLYEWIRQAYAQDHKNHTRIATPQQVQDDIETITKGYGLSGSWWKGTQAEQAALAVQQQAEREAQTNARFLDFMNRDGRKCDQISKIDQAHHLFISVTCQMNDGSRVNYEQYYMNNGRARVRVASDGQLAEDARVPDNGGELPGDWWRADPPR